jgi:hypothetical protein
LFEVGDLIISYHNYNTINVIELQELTFKSNPKLIENKDNIIFVNTDDIVSLGAIYDYLFNWNREKAIEWYSFFNQSEFNLFLDEDAIKIINFLEEKDFRNKNIVCQCEYGRSRSVATATFLYEILKETHVSLFDNNKNHNSRVYNLLKDNFKPDRN